MGSDFLLIAICAGGLILSVLIPILVFIYNFKIKKSCNIFKLLNKEFANYGGEWGEALIKEDRIVCSPRMGISFFYSLNKFEILKSQIVGFTRTETALLSGAIIYYVDEGILSSVVVQILPGNSKEIFEKLAALNPNFFDFETSISQFEIHGIEKPKNQYKTNEVKQNRMSEFSPRTAIILNFDVKNKKFENYIHKNSVLGQNKLLIYPNTLQYIASGTPILTIESKEVVSMTESKDLIHFKLTGESLPERFSISKEIDLLSKLSSAGFDKKLFSSNT